MDFWLLVGRLFRRWYLTIPLLVLVGVIAAGVAAGVQRSYAVDTQVLLVPAGTAPSVIGSDAPAANPLLLANRSTLDAATQSVTFVLDSPARATERRTEHPGTDVSYALVEEAPIITVRVTGEDPDAVSDATAGALRQIDDVLLEIEEPLGTAPASRIDTVPLAQPTLVAESGDRNRVLIGTLVAGVLTAGLLVLAVDHLLRRRLERLLTVDLDEEVGRLHQQSYGPGAHRHPDR